jgi:hypothetical protein
MTRDEARDDWHEMGYYRPVSFNERDCFTQKTEMRKMSLACPKCGHRADYQVRWTRHTKKDRIPGGAADPSEKARFQKLRDYLYRMDDDVTCSRCRRRFEIPSHQSMIFVDELAHGMPDYTE